MPPVLRRSGALGVALALTICAFGAPVVSANSTDSAGQANSSSAWSGPSVAFVEDWLVTSEIAQIASDAVAPAAYAPVAESRTSDPTVGWHTTSNTSGHLVQNRPERPTTTNQPKPSPTQARSDARRIIRIARSNLGARFRMGAVGGGNYFDCSGLVYSVYKDAGLVSKIGGSRMVGTAYWRWFQRRGLANRRDPKPGDLIIWGQHGKAEHMGIYIGGGRAISALVNPWGVRVHRVAGLFDAHARSRMRVLAYLHVHLQ